MAGVASAHTEPGSQPAWTEVMDVDAIRRATWRMAHEVVERNPDVAGLVVLGLRAGGVSLAESLGEILGRIGEDAPCPAVEVGALDVSMHRDDFALRPVQPLGVSEIPGDLEGAVVVLVDDVLFTGRTVRAALDALVDYGRPRLVQLAVMVDRGHRELPIRADFVGLNLPTSLDETVEVGPSTVRLGRPRP